MKLTIEARTLVSKIVCTLLFVATFGWLFFLAGVRKGEQTGMRIKQGNEEVFVLDKRITRVSELSEPARREFERSFAKAEEGLFNTQFNLYREKLRATQNELVERYLTLEAEAKKRNKDELREEILKIVPATREDAKSLFLASDPAASLKDFEKLEPQLRAYIDEVLKREAFDKLVRKLESDKRGQIKLEAPRRQNVSLNLDGFPKYGNSDAKHTVVNFVDYFCDGCAGYNVALAQLAQEQSDKAQFVFVPFPYSRPDRSIALARGSLCADVLHKFMEYHMAAVRLGIKVKDANAFEVAVSAAIPTRDFLQCYAGGTSVAAVLQQAQTEATRAGVLGTPVLFFDNAMIEGPDGVEIIRQKLESHLPSAERKNH